MAGDQLSDLNGLHEGERDRIANAASTAATIWQHLPDINWAGFYFLKGGGTAAAGKTTVVVLDVHKFPGHIACDSASKSEIVVPLIRKRRLIGVLEIDRPSLDRFAEADRIGCEAVAAAAYVVALNA
jgi:GAF domain-containing protein